MILCPLNCGSLELRRKNEYLKIYKWSKIIKIFQTMIRQASSLQDMCLRMDSLMRFNFGNKVVKQEMKIKKIWVKGNSEFLILTSLQPDVGDISNY